MAVEMDLYALASLTDCQLSQCQSSVDDRKGMWKFHIALAHYLPSFFPVSPTNC